MASFKANPSAGMVFLPGYGRVRPGDVLMGDQWRKFAPHLLVEVPDPPAEQPLEVRVAPKKAPLEAPKPLEEEPLEVRETVPKLPSLTEEKQDPPKPKPKVTKKLVRRRSR